MFQGINLFECQFLRKPNGRLRIKHVLRLLAVYWIGLTYGADAISAENFKSYEIRVQRSRFFSKKGRIELGGEVRSIMNETFVRTYQLTALLGYHLSESWGLELAGSYGVSLDREEKRILFDEYDIKTQVFRTAYALEGAVLWTPIYGKWQLPSGKLIYFDTYFTGGAGMTAFDWQYKDFCVSSVEDGLGGVESVQADRRVTYPNWLAGLGQRFFLSSDTAIRWDFRFHGVMYDVADAQCTETEAAEKAGTDTHFNLTLAFGASTFF